MQWSDFIGSHGGRSCLTKWNVTKFLYSVTAFFVPANTLYCSLNYIGKISDWICKLFRPTLAHDILQTPIVPRDQVPLTCPSLFQVILRTQIWVGSRPFHPQKSFCKVLSVHLLFLENVNLNLTCERHSKSLYWLWKFMGFSNKMNSFLYEPIENNQEYFVSFINLHDLHIRGWKRNYESWIIVTKLVRITNLCTWARESWKTRVWEKLNKIDVWINGVRSSECRTWHFRESRIFKYFSAGNMSLDPLWFVHSGLTFRSFLQ